MADGRGRTEAQWLGAGHVSLAGSASTPLASMSSLKIIFGSFIVFVMVAYCTNEMKSK